MHRIKLIILAVFCYTSSHAQLTENSPYSRYAIGILHDWPMAHLNALGGTFAVGADSAMVNPGNHASWSFLARHRPAVDLQVGGNNRWLETSDASDVSRVIAISHFGLGIPIAKRGGMGFGVAPYSRVGYFIRDSVSSAGYGNAIYTYDGIGDINRVYAGASWLLVKPRVGARPSKDSLKLKPAVADSVKRFRVTTEWSVGAGASLLFGTYTHNRRVDYEDASYFSTLVSQNTQVADVLFDLGTLVKLRMGRYRNWFVSVGATSTLPGNINGKRDAIAMNLKPNGFGGYLLRDTSYHMSAVSGYISTPFTFSGGMSLEWRSAEDLTVNPERRSHRLLFMAQYSMSDWSSYGESFNDTTLYSDFLNASWAFGAGLQFTPNDLRRFQKKINYLSKISYRLGFSYKQDYLQLRDTPLTDVGISFGLGLPVAFPWAYSSINLGATAGEKGTMENNLVRERYISYRVGFTFSPEWSPWNKDKWFLKRKYD
jgi:hypothetical protein